MNKDKEKSEQKWGKVKVRLEDKVLNGIGMGIMNKKNKAFLAYKPLLIENKRAEKMNQSFYRDLFLVVPMPCSGFV